MGILKKKFIQAAVNAGVAVCCSEITEQCMDGQKRASHVFEGSFQLGLPVHANALQCRGAMRVFVDENGIRFDRHQATFRERMRNIKSRLCAKKEAE
jgi:hypothetical protein